MPLRLLIHMLLCLAVTVAAEGLIMLLLFRSWRYVYHSCLANLLTNPSLNVLLVIAVGLFGESAYLATLIPLELLAVVAEAFVYRLLCGFRIKRAIAVSGLLNVSSFAIGFAFFAVFPQSVAYLFHLPPILTFLDIPPSDTPPCPLSAGAA